MQTIIPPTTDKILQRIFDFFIILSWTWTFFRVAYTNGESSDAVPFFYGKAY